MTKVKKTVEKAVDNSIRILGIDGLEILLLVSLAVIGFLTLKFRWDFLMGIGFPIILLIIVFAVSIGYASTLSGFIKMQKKQSLEKKEETDKEDEK